MTPAGQDAARRAAERLGLDVEVIERLVAERGTARARRDFGESDRLREILGWMGVKLRDGQDGSTAWEIDFMSRKSWPRPVFEAPVQDNQLREQIEFLYRDAAHLRKLLRERTDELDRLKYGSAA